MRAQLSLRRILAEIALILLIAVILAIIGPFGSFVVESGPERLAYWLRTGLAAYALYRPGITVGARLALRLGFAEGAGWIAAVLVLGAPLSLYLWYFGPDIMPDRPWPGIEAFMDTYWQVLSLSGPAMAVLWLSAAPKAEQTGAAPAAAPAASVTGDAPGPSEPPARPRLGPLLSERLPPRLGDDVIALQMEDHYVRVHTTRGDALILMRMADAVADLAQVDGLRVHRSWWAARHAVVAVERQGRSATLRLSNGLAVPVARDRLPQLRERGWLEA